VPIRAPRTLTQNIAGNGGRDDPIDGWVRRLTPTGAPLASTTEAVI
jgi:hypothetical protein